MKSEGAVKLRQRHLNIRLIPSNCLGPAMDDLSSFCVMIRVFCCFLCSIWSELSSIKLEQKPPMMLCFLNNVQRLNNMEDLILVQILLLFQEGFIALETVEQRLLRNHLICQQKWNHVASEGDKEVRLQLAEVTGQRST
jgi:hypothetical protein